MKVAVYTIALNEEQFVERWADSAKDADYLLIADTGSTDNTKSVALLYDVGIHVIDVNIKPWRFDDARNAALAHIPKDIDYCIALDMDEVLLPGWREELEKAFVAGATRPRYKYTWSWKEDGTPGLEYGGDKIHARNGYRWKHPVHEVISSYGIEEVQCWVGLEIHHHPDNTKSRGQYFPLLQLAVQEDPSDDRNAFYYARELYFNRMYELASQEFKRHLLLPRATWAPERAASHRFLAKCNPENAIQHLTDAIAESERREALVELAIEYHNRADWENCYLFSTKALSITEKPLDYLCEDFAWGFLPYDLAALSAYHLGKKKEAIAFNVKAMKLNPTEQRLKDNHEFYKA